VLAYKFSHLISLRSISADATAPNATFSVIICDIEWCCIKKRDDQQQQESAKKKRKKKGGTKGKTSKSGLSANLEAQRR
jgi:hypothetical protein